MIILSKKQENNIKKRNAKHTALLQAGRKDDGFFGEINDIACNNPRSRNSEKSLANVPDCFVKIGGKKVAYKKCECKVNEGAKVTETELLNNVSFVCVSLYNPEDNKRIFTDSEIIAKVCGMPRKIVSVKEFLEKFPRHWKTKSRGVNEEFAIMYRSATYRKFFDTLPEFSNYEIMFIEK